MCTRRRADLISSAVMTREVRNSVMLSPPPLIPVEDEDEDDDDDDDDEAGSRGSRMPVRGIFHSPSFAPSASVLPSAHASPAGWGSTLRSVLSSPTPVAMTGREPDARPMHNLHTALTTSSATMSRHRAFSPARLASISSSNCVYCIVLKSAVHRA